MLHSLEPLTNRAVLRWGLGLLGATTILSLNLPTAAQTSVVFGQTGQVVTIPNTFGQPTFVMPPVSAYPPLWPFPGQTQQPIIYQANPYNQPVLIYPRSGSGFYGGNNQPIIYQASPHNQPVLIYPPRN